MKKLGLLIFLFVCQESVAIAQNESGQFYLSMEQAKEIALKKNRMLISKGIEVLEQQSRLADARAQRLPALSVTADYRKNSDWIYAHESQDILPTVYNMGINAQLPIYQGGRIGLQSKAEGIELRTAAESQNLARLEVSYSVSAKYLEIVRLLHFRSLVVSHITTAKQRKQEIEAMFKAGTVLKSDLLRANIDLSKRLLVKRSIEDQIKIGENDLKLYTGIDTALSLKLTDTLVAATAERNDYQVFFSKAMNSPEIKIAHNQIEKSQNSQQQIKSLNKPDLSLYAQGALLYPDNLLSIKNQAPVYSYRSYGVGSIGLSLSIPLSYYKNDHKIAALKRDIEQKKNQMEAVKDQVGQQLLEAYTLFDQSKERIGVLQKNVEQAAENYRIIKVSYFNQLSLLTDLLDADEQLLQADFDLISANIESQTRYLQLLKIAGTI